MMAERAAAAEAMFNSLSAEQQGELRGLFAADDAEHGPRLLARTAWSSNLRQATPDIDWNRAHRMRGDEGALLRRRDRRSPSSSASSRVSRSSSVALSAAQGLPEVDVDAVRRQPRRRRRAPRRAPAARAAGPERRRASSTAPAGASSSPPKGVRQIGQQALRDLFDQLRDSPDARRAPRRDRLARAATARRPPSRGSPASRSRLHLRADAAQRAAAARARAPRSACTPTTSRSRSTSRRAVPRRSSPSTCRCRWRCATTSCRPRRWSWR